MDIFIRQQELHGINFEFFYLSELGGSFENSS